MEADEMRVRVVWIERASVHAENNLNVAVLYTTTSLACRQAHITHRIAQPSQHKSVQYSTQAALPALVPSCDTPILQHGSGINLCVLGL